jgi:hypothetical protein
MILGTVTELRLRKACNEKQSVKVVRSSFPPERVITYICDGTIGKLAVPLVLDLCDLATVVEDVDDRRDGLLHTNALDLVAGLHGQADGIA